MKIAQTTVLLANAAAAALLAAPAAFAQAWPARPIHLVSAYPPGGTTDQIGRLAAPRLGAALGQPIIVENKAGASGMIGSDFIAKSEPDGYNFLVTTPATHTLAQFVNRNIPYDPVKDFTPVTVAAESVGYVLASASLPVGSFKELIEYAKRNPGKVSYGSPAQGSTFHLAGVQLERAAGIRMEHIPYKGGAQVARAVAAGEVDIALISNGSGIPVLRAGKGKLLAVLDAERDPDQPGVPSVTELFPDIERPGDWLGIYGPPRLPRPILVRFHAELVKALKAPEVAGPLLKIGLRVVGNTPEQFAEQIARAIRINRQLVQEAGIKPE